MVQEIKISLLQHFWRWRWKKDCVNRSDDRNRIKSACVSCISVNVFRADRINSISSTHQISSFFFFASFKLLSAADTNKIWKNNYRIILISLQRQAFRLIVVENGNDMLQLFFTDTRVIGDRNVLLRNFVILSLFVSSKCYIASHNNEGKLQIIHFSQCRLA